MRLALISRSRRKFLSSFDFGSECLPSPVEGTLGDIIENSDVIPCEVEAGAKLLDLSKNRTGRSELCCSE